MFLNEYNFTCDYGEPDFGNLLRVEGSDNVNAPSYQGVVYVYDRDGSVTAGMSCTQLPTSDLRDGAFAPVWTSSNGPPFQPSFFNFALSFETVGWTSGYLLKINGCVVYHYTGDTNISQGNGAGRGDFSNWNVVLTTQGSSVLNFQDVPPTCPSPPSVCTANGDDTCQWIQSSTSSTYSYGYVYDELGFDTTQGDCNGVGLPDCVYDGTNSGNALTNDGHCDSETSRWRTFIVGMWSGIPEQDIWGTPFLCSYEPDATGACFSTDITDCCTYVTANPNACSSSRSGIRLPLSVSAWRNLLTNSSVQSIVTPPAIQLSLAKIVDTMIRPRSSPVQNYLSQTAGNHYCYNTSLVYEATSCAVINSTDLCRSSYKKIVGHIVVSACKWSGGLCERDSQPYRACTM